MQNTVLLVDDHPVFRKGLLSLLEDEEDMQVVGEAGDGQAALSLIGELSPDIVVMDVTMPGLNGIEATRRITSDFPDTTIVALSIHSEKQFVQDMLKAGAAGYILKESVPEELIKGIRSVMLGEGYLSPAITEIVLSQFRKSYTHDHTLQQLSIEIVETKLHAPNKPDSHIIRTRLLEFLEKHRQLPLQTIIAPAGYGKSTIVSFWLAKHEWSTSWLSLDENDNDLRQFIIYFAHAVKVMFPNALSKTTALVNAESLPPVHVLASMLVNELNLIQHDFVLVLDDFHCISEKSVHDLLTELFRHPPQCMHLIIIGRTDPFFPMNKFRAHGLLAEIRLKDLRFTQRETTKFLEVVLKQDVDETLAFSWHEKTEGWITGLRLAILSKYHQEELVSLLEEIHGSGRYIKEYLFNEVFKKQPENIRNHILSVSILERFCAPLFEALCPYPKDECELGGWGVVRWLKNNNLFQVPLDNEGRWYRFHNLFQELLQNKLKRLSSTDEISKLHAKAGNWFAENGYVEEAITHYLAGGKAEEAGELVIQVGHELIDKERVVDLERLLQQLPRQIIQNNPFLLILEAWIARVKILIPQIAEKLDRAEEILRQKPPSSSISDVIWGYLYTIRSYERYCLLDHEEALSCAKKAQELLPPEYPYMRCFAVIIEAGTLQMSGSFREAFSVINAAQRDPLLQNDNTQAVLLAGLSPICLLEADQFTLQTAAARLLKLGGDTRLPVYRSWGRMYLACSNYQRNELKKAEHILASHLEDRHLMYPHVAIDGAVILSLCYQLSGRPQDARDVADVLSQHAIETGHPGLLMAEQAFQAELALRQGRMGSATAWAQVFVPRQLHAHYFFYLPELTLAKVLVTMDTSDSLQQAQNLLSDMEKFSRATNNRSILIPTLALQAILLENHNQTAALQKISEAVSLAKPGGGLRFFLEFGTPMRDQLQKLLKQRADVDFIDKILAAFSDEQSTVAVQISDNESQGSPLLADPLTLREQEILNTLAQGRTNKEIAENLFISVDTVKTHLKKIYQKLEVSSRLQAVTKANALGAVQERDAEM